MSSCALQYKVMRQVALKGMRIENYKKMVRHVGGR